MCKETMCMLWKNKGGSARFRANNDFAAIPDGSPELRNLALGSHAVDPLRAHTRQLSFSGAISILGVPPENSAY